MSKRENYERKTEELLDPILTEKGFELWDVEYVREGQDYYLRAYIDKPGGISIDDCVDVSRALSDKLDEVNFIDDAYILEVSSPGLFRVLKKDRELEKSLGRTVAIKLYKAIGKEKEFRGTLKSFSDEIIEIETKEEGKEFNRSDIASVRLDTEL
ncbi:MAG: ribosome maturation factor RimP [Lachnospiraceae bacterium]|nr:ribosome maturation factor RimP [Lachnospiraceae bacterium]